MRNSVDNYYINIIYVNSVKGNKSPESWINKCMQYHLYLWITITTDKMQIIMYKHNTTIYVQMQVGQAFFFSILTCLYVLLKQYLLIT